MPKSLMRRAIGDANVERLKRIRFRYQDTSNLKTIFSCPPALAEAELDCVEYSLSGYDTFFGYYDKNPESECGNKVLAGATKGRRSGRSNQDELQVGYFERSNPDRFIVVARTAAWCWQQGCMLGWFPSDPNTHIVFNTIEGSSYGANIVNVHTRTVEQKLERPIYSVCPQGKFALSCNFSRLHWLRRGYGYPQFPDSSRHEAAPTEDGIWLFELGANKSDIFCSVYDLTQISPLPSMINAQHYVNHLHFSPAGDGFLFIHLWVTEGKQYSRMFTGTISGEVQLLSNSYVSHYCWKNEDEIVIYSHEDGFGLGYHLYNRKSGFIRPLFDRCDLPDGHGTFAPDGKWLLTDTYPDQSGYQKLYILDVHGAELEIARFFHRSALVHDCRCDLHPRWNSNGNRVYVDTAFKGRRRLVGLDVRGTLSTI